MREVPNDRSRKMADEEAKRRVKQSVRLTREVEGGG